MTDTRIESLGFRSHPDHAYGHYSIALTMPPALAELRARKGLTEPMRAYVTIITVAERGSSEDGIYITPEGGALGLGVDSKFVRYDTTRGSYAALCYAKAVIDRLNAEWIDNYTPYTRADWLDSMSRCIT